jgi:aryl-alcohol dehydrogenase-like predicted oxidoreductase
LFHIDGDGSLTAMTETPYAAEDVLQALLEDHPDLLAGGQITPGDPRRWALVAREQGVPDREAASSRWSIDHLFVDQEAVPTLVEVKRSTDTRIRREVVGQLLDYAANGVRYWPLNNLRASFEATQERLGRDPLDVISDLTADNLTGIEEFFDRLGDNLRSGRIRMMFVADLIPEELKRITEFLNEQMTPAEVLAVEVKQYKADDHPGTVLVPTVYGRTATASVKRGTRPRSTREELLARSAPATLEVLKLAQAFAEEHGLVLTEAPSGALLKTKSKGSVANVYLAAWDTLDVPLQPLRDRGWTAEAEQALQELQALTAKRLTVKNPSLPTADVVRHWPAVREVLQRISALYGA